MSRSGPKERKLPRIISQEKVYEQGDVDLELDWLEQRLPNQRDDQIIAIYADISPEGVLALFSAIRLGLKVAICPLREPEPVLRQWLRDVGVNSYVIPSPQFVSILRTSGSTGRPKNAVISGSAHWASACSVNEFFGFTKDGVWALNLPLYHVSGLGILFRVLLADAGLFIAKESEDLHVALKHRQITHLSLVPTQLRRLLDARADLSGLKAIVVGGDALPDDLRAQVVALNLPVYETYGLTETASMVWARACRKNQHGTVLPHAIMRLAEDGEILVGGQSLFAGYVGGESFDRSGQFFKTGDLACDLTLSHGPLVKGRKSNRIISGGENVQAEEIERILEAHPAIISSIVVGRKDANFGMRPQAYIQWQKNPVSDDELIAYLKSRLARYKIPKAFLPWPENAPSGIKKPRAWFSSYVAE